jgi:TRAP-type C4-dicarboxylate transport system permease small subunit
METPAPGRLDRVVRRLVEGLAIALIVGLAAICVAEVALRNLAGASLGFGDEMAGYLLVWLTFVGATLAQLDSGHIGADVLSRHLSAAGAHRIEKAAEAVLLLVQLFLLATGIILVLVTLGDRATSLPIPMGLVYAAVPFSALLLAIVHARALSRTDSRERRL